MPIRSRWVVLFAIWSTLALAQAPGRLGYQGRILNPDGTPRVGATQLQFSLFSAAAGGTALWTETQTVQLTDGYYSTFLASSVDAALTGQTLYLEVSLGGSPLSPRQELGSVAYAVRAQKAREVTGGPVVASSINIGATPVIDAAGKLSLSSLPACTAGRVLVSTGPGWSCGLLPGAEIVRAERTTNLQITANNEGTAQAVLSTPAATFDGTPVNVTFFTPSVAGDTQSQFLIFQRDATTLGVVLISDNLDRHAQVTIGDVPSAGQHTYTVRVYLGGTSTGTVRAGTGGAGQLLPASLSVVKR